MKNKKFLLGAILVLTIIGISSYVYLKSFRSPANSSSQESQSTNSSLENPATASNQPQNSPQLSLDELFQKAQSFYQEKKYQDAENYYQQILAQAPENVQALLGLGNTYRDWGKTDLAITQYEKVIAIDPHKIEGYLNLAQTYKEKGQKDKAEEILKKGLDQNPGNAALQNSLDILYLEPSTGEGR